MGRRNGGYGGYRGRRTFHDILKWVAAILAVLVVILAGVLVFGQRYLVFRDQGVRLELPFLHQKDGQQSGPGDVSLEVRPQGDQSDGDQSAQEPGADETKSLRAVELPLSAVQDGTAQDQLEQAGADALILEMKDSQGDSGLAERREPGRPGDHRQRGRQRRPGGVEPGGRVHHRPGVRLPGQHPALSGQPGGPEGGLWQLAGRGEAALAGPGFRGGQGVYHRPVPGTGPAGL